MAYTLQAILGPSETLTDALIEGTHVVLLQAGVSMLPLGRAFLEAHGATFLPLIDAGESAVPSTIGEISVHLAKRGVVAYVEAEFHGGEGMQASVVFYQSGTHDPPRLARDAINAALKALGVHPHTGNDEFSVVGLGLHSDTEQWLLSAGV